jgi:hypothetical protein
MNTASPEHMDLCHLPAKQRSAFSATSAQSVNGYARNEDEEDFGCES